MKLARRQWNETAKATAILSFGSMLAAAMDAGERLNATVVNMRFVKPIDEELVAEITRSHDLIVTIEEHVVAGGAGSAVNEVLVKHGILTRTVNLGLPDEHVDHGVPKIVFAKYGMDADAIVQKVEAIRGLDSMEQVAQ